tara:strand:- start:307 stop:672 length:366 start_codon:yes stop_codon:yes gene_type:complete
MKLNRQRLMEMAGLKESLDPNSTYQIDTTYEGGEPSDVKQITGDPRSAAIAIKKAAVQEMGSDEFVSAFELDKDTYYILTGEETITVVGRPKSPKYGSFWSSPDGDQLDQMDEDSMSAVKI